MIIYSAVFHFQWIVWEILQVAKDSPPNKTFCITYNGRKRDEDKTEIPLISVVECSLKWFYSVVLRSGFCYRLSHWIKLENLCLVTPTEATWHEWWHLPQSIRQFYSDFISSQYPLGLRMGGTFFTRPENDRWKSIACWIINNVCWTEQIKRIPSVVTRPSHPVPFRSLFLPFIATTSFVSC